MNTPVSEKIRARLRAAGKRFHANDSIADHIEPNELPQVQDEVEQKLLGVLQSLVIDTEGDHNTRGTARRIARMYLSEVFRGRYRTGFEKPQPIEPNKVLEYTWSLHTQNYTFKKDHRIMVQVQSTWFPIIDRNPQTFVPNIFQASEADFKSATHRVYRTPQYPSRVDVPVVRGR